MDFTDLLSFPDDNFLWGIKPKAFDYGLCQEHVSTIPVSYVTERELVIPIQTSWHVLALLKLIPAQEQSKEEYSRYCLVEVSENVINLKVRFPFKDYYKLMLFFQNKENRNHKYTLVGTFLVDATKLTNPCLPFPRTYSKYAEYCCSLIQPLNGILPENSAVECKFKSSMIDKAYVENEIMQKNGDTFYVIAVTPNAMGRFRVSGRTKNDTVEWILMEFQVAPKDGDTGNDIIKKNDKHKTSFLL